MSIIFKKLKNLKKPPVENAFEKQGLSRDQNIYTFKKLILSPKGFLFILAAIIGFGCISFYSLFFLKSILDDSSRNAIVVNHVTPPGAVPGIDPNDPMSSAPPPPPGSEGAMNGPAQNGTRDDTADKEEEFQVPEYFQLKTGNGPEQVPEAPETIMPDTDGRIVLKIKKKTPVDPESDSIYSMIKKKASHLKFLPNTGTSGTRSGPVLPKRPEISSTENPVFSQTSPDKPRAYQPAINKIKNPGLNTEPAQKTAVKSTKPVQKPVQEPARELDRELDRRQIRHKTRQVSKMSSLAADLEQAVAADDISKADAIIEKIQQSTDKQSDYYIKLKAFQMIREKNYDQAKFWLNKILIQDDQDLEAGLNMAIIEIREKSFETAKKRLIQLQEQYPSHSGITRLLDQL